MYAHSVCVLLLLHTGSLLDHIGGYLNPLMLIKRIPRGLTIPRLRDRLRSIIADFRTQVGYDTHTHT